ncbi:hypothetical protein Lalb_Chr14g0373991 [Lupinus albus]|uniref:Uncharacterized protein n=1 Tax=Lupinus albus TaxID=3870 RepID=A0A6A4PGG5_LUPAL|nr:hypothetical protein Lalb_Chr14g0373991 [Lupinus albus]
MQNPKTWRASPFNLGKTNLLFLPNHKNTNSSRNSYSICLTVFICLRVYLELMDQHSLWIGSSHEMIL